ncbi:putative pyruvate, phosphate dikinase regulatory protein [compost metagenome]
MVNYPVIPELTPPVQLKDVRGKIIGLTINAEHLVKIRSERLKAMGLPDDAKYASLERVEEELNYAQSVFQSLGCPVIDVTDKAIEEIAALIMKYI